MIEVGRNNIIVRNVDPESREYKTAQMRYSLYDKVTHKYTFHAFYQYGNDLYFPSSIGLEEIRRVFPSKAVSVDYTKTAKAKPLEYTMLHAPRDELQEKAIAFLLRVRKDPETHQRFLSLETGKGKTYVTINAISKLKKRAMIIVDTLDLADQWKREFLNHTNLAAQDIVILSGQESIDKQMALPTGKVYIAIHRTLSNLISNDMTSIGKLMGKLGIGIRIFDESHVEYMNICRINSLSNVEYTIYLTATPSRSAYQDDSLYAKVFRRIPYFNGKELGSEKYCKVIMCKMNSHPGLDDRIAARTKYGFNQAKWASYVANDGYEFLLEALVKLFDSFKLISRDKKVAIMLPTIELIKKIKDDLTNQYPGIEIGTFIGEISKDKRLEELSKKFILTNDKIFDKGIDVKDLEILILMVPISSAVKTEQIVGRLRDRKDYSSIVIDVTDIGFDECVRQSKLRKRFYKKRAKEIIEIKNIL